MDAVEKWGVNVDEAVGLALQEMKLTRDQVNVTVLEESSRGFFGIGSKLAKVRVEPIVIEKPEKEIIREVKEEAKEEAKAVRPAKEAKASSPARKKSEKKPQKKEKKQKQVQTAGSNIALDGVDKNTLEIVEDHPALTFLKEVTQNMGISLDFTARTGEDLVYIEMSGSDARTVIGKRGQTLDAIQYLTSLVVNKDQEKYIKVVLDAENYRAKRQKTLEQLANRLAGKVTKTGKYVKLEPMNPYERKVIHATLQKNPDVVTRSEGEEPYRRVIIERKK